MTTIVQKNKGWLPCARKSHAAGFLMTAFLLIGISAAGGAQDLVGGYSMPMAAPQYPTHPYPFTDNQLYVITFKTTAETLRRLVPQPLRPNQEQLMSLYIGRFTKPSVSKGAYTFPAFAYQEVALFVPSTFGKKAGNFCVAMYLDKISPTVSGREVFGYPKKSADLIEIREENGKMTGRMERFGITLVNVSFERGEKVEPTPNPPYVPWFLLKAIPSARKEAPPEVLQLNATVGSWTFKALYKGKASLELGFSATDPWDRIPIVEIVKADYRVVDITLTDAEILHDYLKTGPR